MLCRYRCFFIHTCHIKYKLAISIDSIKKFDRLILQGSDLVLSINEISERILNFVQRYDRDSFEQDDYSRAWLRYGIEITLSSILNILIIFILSIVFSDVIEGLVFLATFISIRQFTGGFHASSYLKCNVTFAACYATVIYVYHFLNEVFIFNIQIILLAICVATISFVCPIENPHKPITNKDQFIKCKITSIVMFLMWGIIGLFLIKSGCELGKVILITLQLIVLLCLISIILERRRLNEGS